jgi:hypothetical protein
VPPIYSWIPSKELSEKLLLGAKKEETLFARKYYL